jgi:hypothetical protein
VPTINSRLTQSALEVIPARTPNARLTQAALEVIYPFGGAPAAPATPSAHVTQAVLEVIVPRGSSYLPNRTLVCDLESERWHSDTRGFTAFYDEGTAGNLLASRQTALCQLESGLLDTDQYGTAAQLPLKYLSGFDNCGYPENDKVFADLVIDGITNGQPVTVQVAFNDDYSTLTPVGSFFTYAGAPRAQFTFALGPDQLGLTGRSIAVQLSGTAPAAQPIIITGIHLHYYVEARKAQTWDTGWSDWGTPNVKQIDFLELDINAPGGVTLELFSNLSSQANATYAAPATSGHTLLQLPISKFSIDQTNPDCFEGQLLRIAGTTNPNTIGADDSFQLPFQLWAARARYREIGVYVNGANGEEWITFPDDLGEMALVKIARAIEFDYEITGTGGAVSFNLFTDLPADAMAVRRNISIAAATRRTQRFRLAGSTKGKLWRFQFLPANTAILRLYRMRLLCKAVGSSEDWHWYVVPLPGTNLLQQWKEFPIAA